MVDNNDFASKFTLDGSEGRAELQRILGDLRKLTPAAKQAGDAVDASAAGMAKQYVAVASAIERVETMMDRMAASQARRSSNITISGANAATAQTNAATASSVGQSRSTLAAQNAVNAATRQEVMLREQANRDLQNEQRLLLVAAQTEEVANRSRIANLREADRIARQIASDEARAARDALRAEEQRKRAILERARTERTAAGNTAAAQRAAANAGSERTSAISAERASSLYDVSQINATRYALYDVSRIATIAGTAIGSIGGFSIVAAAQAQESFAQVQRAMDDTGQQSLALRQDLLDLTTNMPASFQDVAGVAQLGAQLGIANEDLDSFSETVTQFASTTNVSAEQAATSFGRLSNLLDVDPSEFQNLGSAIYEVGIKSVATESEILKMSEQISGSASAYDFSAQSVVGLSSALASLAIQPEAARGSLTRMFGDIEKAAAQGGSAIEPFAKLLKLSAEDAVELWNSRPDQFFSQLIDGLGQSTNLLQSINDIGFGANVRDVNLLQRLAVNSDFLNQQLGISADAYQNATALGEGYEIAANTLNAKLKELWNTIKAAAITAGGPFLSVLSQVADGLKTIFNTIRNNAVLTNFVATLSLIVGGLLLLKGAQGAVYAALLGLRFVLSSLTGVGGASALSMRGLTLELGRTAAAAGITRASLTSMVTTMQGARAAALGLATTAGPIAAMAIVFGVVSAAIQDYNRNWATASKRTETYLGSMDGLGDALAQDTKEFEKTGKAVTTFTAKSKESGDQQDAASGQALNLATVLGHNVVDGADKASAAAQRSVTAWGDATTAYVKAQLQQSEAFKKSSVTSDDFTQAFTAIGADTDKAIKIAATQGEAGVRDYFRRLALVAYQEGEITKKQFQDIGLAGPAAALQTNDLQRGVQAYASALSGLSDKAQQAANANTVLGSSTDTAKEAAADASAKAAQYGSDLDSLSGAADAASTAVNGMFASLNQGSDFGSAIQQLFSGIYDAGNAFGYLNETGRTNLANLQAAMIQTVSYAQLTGANVTDSLALMFVQLQQSGVDTAGLLQLISNQPYIFSADLDVSAFMEKVKQLTGGGGSYTSAMKTMSEPTQQLGINLGKLAISAPRAATGISKTKSAAKEAAKEVKTLNDYASDLNTVFGDAAKYRFGVGDAMQDITDQWDEMRQKVAENNKAIAENKKANREAFAEYKQKIKDTRVELGKYRADLAGLKSELTQKKYFLKIAVQYGDALRGDAIRSDIAGLNSDIADKQNDIAKAQKELKTPFERTTIAIDSQKKSLGDLYQSYQDAVVEYARSGVSQAELSRKTEQLRQDFIRQATQAGYSRASINKYGAAFKDLTYIIQKVPRRITIAATTNPAERALRDFLAKANKSKATPNVAADGGKTYQNGIDAGKKLGDGVNAGLKQRLNSANVTMELETKFGKGQAVAHSTVGGITFANGGFIPGRNAFPIGGYVPGSAPADRRRDNVLGSVAGGGVVALQGGEPIINNAARSKYGDAMFDAINALNFQPNVIRPQITVSGGGGQSGPVDLSQFDRSLLIEIAAAIRAGLVIPASAVQNAVNGANVVDSNRRRG